MKMSRKWCKIFFKRFLRVPIKRVITSCQNDGDDAVTEILGLDHRALTPSQLLDLPIIGGCCLLRPPDLLAPARWVGACVRDFVGPAALLTSPTRCALADAASLSGFRCLSGGRNLRRTFRVGTIEETVVLRVFGPTCPSTLRVKLYYRITGLKGMLVRKLDLRNKKKKRNPRFLID
ncbi:hypothetical protein LAZ67_11001558 [Cordylochernes scorpioides]|uniref:Uncharacterized protein n=1 Tax=Cordylochernes scorpioides TaxID=51811 RepID=A0ABY6KYI0_9ARAC|nr:hypothetical protein LAZ67_11001558 [Cordylochernes scorpioides]